jgi:ADP-heptose:LPS heptosyltransferase
MPDTGPMHLAAALDLPLIQIFINSNEQWYGYSGRNRLIVKGESDLKQIGQFIETHLDFIPTLN